MQDISKRHIKKITFVEFDSAQKHFLSATLMPRTYGIVLIATIVRNLGYDVKVYCEHIAPVDLTCVLESDLVCFSPLTSAANKTFALADYIKKNRNIPLLVGGTFATYFPDLCLEHFDYVIRNEGDDAIIELLNAFKEGKNVNTIKGLSFRTPDGQIMHNEQRDSVQNFDVVQDLSLVDGYARKGHLRLLLTEQRIRWIVLQASRGCPFSCDYCIAPVMYGKQYRTRSIESVIAEIKEKLKYGNYFLFMDNCFTANRKYTKELLKRMIAENIKGRFLAFTRCEVAYDGELLDLLKQSGFHNLYIGAESLNDDVFLRMNKHQTVSKLTQAIQLIREHNIEVTLSFQAGNDEDDKLAVKRAVDFGIEHDVSGIYFISTWSWPESKNPVFAKQRMIIKSLDYTNGHFVTHFPLHMKPSTLQSSILKHQHRFRSLKRVMDFVRQGRWARAKSLLIQRYALSLFEKSVEEYVQYLEEIEQEYYDDNEKLDLNKIAHRQVNYKGEFKEKYQGQLVGNFKGINKGTF